MLCGEGVKKDKGELYSVKYEHDKLISYEKYESLI
jgi:uncharacterized protein Usg